MAERIEKRARPITVELIHHGADLFCTSSHSLFRDGIDVRNIQHDAYRCTTERPGRFMADFTMGFILRFVGEHDVRIANPYFRMSDLPVGHWKSK